MPPAPAHASAAPPRPRLRPGDLPADERRFASLEGQRGLAAVGLLVFHTYQHDRSGPSSAYPYEGSAVHPLLLGLDGLVSWFFVLTAFLLTLPYARAVLEGLPGTSARRSLARRALRVVPLYLVAVMAVWAWRNPRLPGDWRDLLLHLTFTQTLDPSRIFFTIGAAWAVAVEVQFFLLLAVLGALATRTGRRLRTRRARLLLLYGGVAALASGSVAWSATVALVLRRPDTDWHLWFSLPAKLVVFAVGMAVAVLVASRPLRLSPRAAALLRATGLLVVLAAALTRGDGGGGGALFHGVVGVGAALVVLASVAGPQAGPAHRLLTGRVVGGLGLVSYSLYLWHEPLLLGLGGLGLVPEPAPGAFPLTVGVLLVVSVVAAWASYWLLEYPASHLRTRIDGGTTPSAPIADTRPVRRERVA